MPRKTVRRLQPLIRAVRCEPLERRMLLSPLPAGVEFRVNSVTNNAQQAPAIASDADGDFVVVWQGYGFGDALGVFARRINSAGTPLGFELRANTTTSANQNLPAVAMDASGDFVVAWAGTGPGDTGGIFVQRYNAAGGAQGGELRVNTFTTGLQRYPALAMDAVGNFVVAWHSIGQDGSGEGIYAQRYNAAGEAQGIEFRVNTTTAGNQEFAALAMDADGDFAVVWQGSGTVDTSGIFAQRYNAAAAPQGGEFRVNTFTTATQAAASIAMHSSGDFVVTWSSDQDQVGVTNFGIYAQRYDALGGQQGGEFRVNTTTAGTQLPSRVAMDADGDFMVVWDSVGQDGSSSGVYAQNFNAAGVSQGDEFRVNTYTTNAQSVPAVAMDAEGDALVVWQSDLQDGSDNGIYAQLFEEPVPIAAPLVNNNKGATGISHYTQFNPTVVAFDETVLVAFNDSAGSAGISRSTDGGATFFDRGSSFASAPSFARDDLTGRIYRAGVTDVYRSDDGGVSWSSPVAVGSPPVQTRPMHLAVDNFAGTGRGNLYAVYQELSGVDFGTRVYRSTDGGTSFNTGAGAELFGGPILMPRLVVGPDHAVYAFTYENSTLQMEKSTNLGVTFIPTSTVASGLASAPFGDLGLTGIPNGGSSQSFQTNSMPHPAVNPVTGHLYVVFNKHGVGGDRSDIFLAQSINGGTSWSAPVRVNDDATVTDQWNPTIAVSRDGSRVGVFYYSRQEDPFLNNQYRMYGRIATVSGANLTFGPAFPVSDVASLPEFGRDTAISSFAPELLNDYNSSYASDDAFHVVWTDSRDDLPGGGLRDDPNIYYEQIPIGIAPNVTASSFLFETIPHRLRFTFDQNVSTSISTSDMVLENLTTQQTIPTGDLALSYDAVTNTATLSYSGNAGGIVGVLPDGNYRATLLASGITGLDGTPLAANHIFNFFFLNGDANHDGRVNLADFNILAANFGQSPRNFTQGDFNYDTIVNLADFNILAARFGVALGPSAGDRFGQTPIGAIPDDADASDDALAAILA